MLKINALTDVGLVRDSNQDCYKVIRLADDIVFSIVCDGMGGNNGGEYASKIATEEICKIIETHFNATATLEEIKNMLIYSAQKANESIFSYSREHTELTGMGTTMVASLIIKDEVHIVNIGDSRAYHISQSKVRQLTKDHSMVQELVELGELSSEEARNHPNKNIITRALGIEQIIKVDYFFTNININEKVLLCTDGFSNCMNNNKLLEFVSDTNFEHIAEKAINFANSVGGRDNITVVVIERE